MNKLHIETIKTDKNILPIDIYFLLLVGEYTYFSEIIYVKEQTQQCEQVIQFQPRDKQNLILECWKYEPQECLGKQDIKLKNLKFKGLEIYIRHQQQERSRTPELAIKRDASPFGRRDMTPSKL